MASITSPVDFFYKKTRQTLFWMHLAHEPFLVLYTLIPFVLRKDLGSSLLQLSILASLKPILPIFSFYWSSRLTKKKEDLRKNLIGAWVLARVPFLLVPWCSNPWYLILCCAFYELFNKSGIPALMEILKINTKEQSMHRLYTICFVVTFIESILLGLCLTGILKNSIVSWQLCYGVATLISLSSIWPQMNLVFPKENLSSHSPPIDGHKILTPWKEAFSVLRSNPDFARFQYGFMIGGFGLMLAAPSLSLFYVDFLNLSHSEIVTARSILMGVGITASAYFWKKFLNRNRVEKMTGAILFGFFIYFLLLYFSSMHKNLFYISYFIYGITQAGSHLLWNLSGPLFSKEMNSVPFSSVNILMVGLRGCIAPAIGGILCNYLGPEFVIFLGGLICLFGVIYIRLSSRASKKLVQSRAF